MAKKFDNSRSFLRLLFWEGLALAGFLHLRAHPLAHELWGMNFFYGALFFLVTYPILFIYRWVVMGGCLGTILWPLSYLLSLGLGVSSYLWVTYSLLFTGNPFSSALMNHPAAMGFLFVFVYFPLIQPFLGVTRKYQPLGNLVWVLVYSVLGGFLGYVLGWFFSQKIASIQADRSHWFLLWLACVLIGTAAGAVIAQRHGKG